MSKSKGSRFSNSFNVLVEVLVSSPRGNAAIDVSFSDIRLKLYVNYKQEIHQIGIFSLSEIRMLLGRDHVDYLGLENLLSKPSLLHRDDGVPPVYPFSKTLDFDIFIKWAKKYESAYNWTFALKD